MKTVKTEVLDSIANHLANHDLLESVQEVNEAFAPETPDAKPTKVYQLTLVTQESIILVAY